jgi:nucleoside-diphosphate-sugar epimerase
VSTFVVTGAAGLVGKNLVRKLHEAGHRVVAIARSAEPAGWPKTSRWVTADLTEPASYQEALVGAEAVVHLAATTGKARPAVYQRNNVEATERLLEAASASGVGRFVFMSSIAAAFEDRRHYAYAESKISAEQAVRASTLTTLIVRPTMILGEGSPIQASLSKLGRLPLIPMFGSGKVLVQPIDVADLVRVLTAVLGESPPPSGTVLEVGGPEIYSMEELVRRLRRAAGVEGKARFLHLPIGLLRAGLAAVESVLFPVLPFTAGQLASFANDSKAAPNQLVQRLLGAAHPAPQV